MESRLFIKNAATLITRIQSATDADRESVQKDITNLFAGLQNYSLSSAYRLRDAAKAAGFIVDTRVQQRIAEFD